MIKSSPLQFTPRIVSGGTASGPDDFAEKAEVVLAANLKRLRAQHGLSLDSFAKVCGVSRSMLSQIENGRSAPSIGIVCKIARGLGLSLSELLNSTLNQPAQILPAGRALTLRSTSGEFSTRALFPVSTNPMTEFYELRFSAGGIEQADAHAPGTMENLIVVRGALEITISSGRYVLSAGDAFFFQADEPHIYRNVANEEALIYLVMTYRENAEMS